MINIQLDKLVEFGLDQERARDLLAQTGKMESNQSPEDAWRHISQKLLKPDDPIKVHDHLWRAVYDKDKENEAVPCWSPSEAEVRECNVTKFRTAYGLPDYEALHRYSVLNKTEFIKCVVKELGIVFQEPFSEIADYSNPCTPNWFHGAKMNIAQSCFKSPGARPAIIFQREGGKIEEMSYAELDALSNQVANGLRDLGFKTGDAMAIDMVMTAESVAIYLGILKAGCVAVSIADSLAPDEISKRLDISNTQLVFTQDVVHRMGKKLPMYEKVRAAEPKRVVALSSGDEIEANLVGEDLAWDSFLSDNDQFETVVCDPMDPVNILFSSGTTGEPKAIPWNHTTPIKCAMDAYFHHDIREEDVVAWPTNLGWMMGPWLIFASLISNGTMALYYGAPTGEEFGRFVQDAKVKMLGVVPSMVRQWKTTNCLKGLDWTFIRNFSSTGESSNADDMFWLMAQAGYKPVIEYCGGTEIGGGYLTATMVQPAAPSFFTTPAIGLDFAILDESEKQSSQGEVYVLPPSIGLSNNLLNKDHDEEYYEGTPSIKKGYTGGLGTSLPEQAVQFSGEIAFRRHGDEIEITSNGFFRTHGRVDDTMNLGGIKVSSIEIERVLNGVNGVKETAAIAVSPKTGGPSELVVYVVMADTNTNGESLSGEFQLVIKKKLNPLFRVKQVVVTETLPRTASNKIMRRTLRKTYHEKKTDPKKSRS